MRTKQQQVLIILICLAGVIFVFRLLHINNRRGIAEYDKQFQQNYDSVPSSEDVQPSAQPLVPDEHLTKDATTTRETTLPGGAEPAGFITFDKLYVWNGTLYAVTTNPKAFPDLKLIISQPNDLKAGSDTNPTAHDMQIISPEVAKEFLGDYVVDIPGMSFIIWDPQQFMAHYYHWWGEIILGAMRAYFALALIPGMKIPLAEPRRFLLPHIEGHGWRDHAGLDVPLMRAAWPDATIERKASWRDLIKLNQTFVFERAMIISRPSAHRSPLAPVWQKMIASTMNITAPDNFWKPIQERVVRNIVGYLPAMDQYGTVISIPASTAPLVTYISRQTGGRRLTDAAHEGLIQSLMELADEGICEVHVVAMEKLSFSEQLHLIARTTIMLGVHGNGLTHQLWMPSSPRSTVIEIFFPNVYLHDYEILARNMGHKHYAVWNDTYLTYSPGQWFEGVQGGPDVGSNVIPVHGATVADIIRERLGAN